MIRCPACHAQEIAGALFCSECGAQLVFAAGYAPASTRVVPVELRPTGPAVTAGPGKAPRRSGPLPSYPGSAGEAPVLLNLLDHAVVVPIVNQPEVTLGRFSQDQPIVPDVDLSSYQAFEAGVSRLHALLKINGGQVTIQDLGSANGTRLNGQKIPPNLPFPLASGDLLVLGRFKIQVRFAA